MKKTKLSPIKASKIKVLTMPFSNLKLNKCAGHEYAVTTPDNCVLYVFESPSLSRFLSEKGRRKIRGIRLVDLATRHGAGAKYLTELHFHFCDKKKVILDGRDRIFVLDEVTSKKCLHSPCGLWGLVPKEPILHMLLTARMVDLIESFAEEDQIPHVLQTYWHDWTLSRSTSSHPTRTVKIRGELGIFKAKKINSKMVKFDTA